MIRVVMESFPCLDKMDRMHCMLPFSGADVHIYATLQAALAWLASSC
jgi:hypothetical protein